MPMLGQTIEPENRVGSLFAGRFQLTEELGRGGMGVVYAAEDRYAERKVALKVINARYARDPDFIRRFRRECTAVANLSHENIVRVYETNKTERGQWYLVMELLDGLSLRELLDRSEGRRLELLHAAVIAIQIADALRHAHGKGCWHRDIKPENVLVGRRGRAWLLDFGLVKDARSSSLTDEQRPLGTLRYMAPEQIRDRARMDGRVDFYQLGCVLFEMCTGRSPNEAADDPGATATEILAGHAFGEPLAVRDFLPDAPRSVQAILDRMLAKEPKDRYPDAGALGRDLHDLILALVPASHPAAMLSARAQAGATGEWELVTAGPKGRAAVAAAREKDGGARAAREKDDAARGARAGGADLNRRANEGAAPRAEGAESADRDDRVDARAPTLNAQGDARADARRADERADVQRDDRAEPRRADERADVQRDDRAEPRRADERADVQRAHGDERAGARRAPGEERAEGRRADRDAQEGGGGRAVPDTKSTAPVPVMPSEGFSPDWLPLPRRETAANDATGGARTAKGTIRILPESQAEAIAKADAKRAADAEPPAVNGGEPAVTAKGTIRISRASQAEAIAKADAKLAEEAKRAAEASGDAARGERSAGTPGGALARSGAAGTHETGPLPPGWAAASGGATGGDARGAHGEATGGDARASRGEATGGEARGAHGEATGGDARGSRGEATGGDARGARASAPSFEELEELRREELTAEEKVWTAGATDARERLRRVLLARYVRSLPAGAPFDEVAAGEAIDAYLRAMELSAGRRADARDGSGAKAASAPAASPKATGVRGGETEGARANGGGVLATGARGGETEGARANGGGVLATGARREAEGATASGRIAMVAPAASKGGARSPGAWGQTTRSRMWLGAATLGLGVALGAAYGTFWETSAPAGDGPAASASAASAPAEGDPAASASAASASAASAPAATMDPGTSLTASAEPGASAVPGVASSASGRAAGSTGTGATAAAAASVPGPAPAARPAGVAKAAATASGGGKALPASEPSAPPKKTKLPANPGATGQAPPPAEPPRKKLPSNPRPKPTP